MAESLNHEGHFSMYDSYLRIYNTDDENRDTFLTLQDNNNKKSTGLLTNKSLCSSFSETNRLHFVC